MDLRPIRQHRRGLEFVELRSCIKIVGTFAHMIGTKGEAGMLVKRAEDPELLTIGRVLVVMLAETAIRDSKAGIVSDLPLATGNAMEDLERGDQCER